MDLNQRSAYFYEQLASRLEAQIGEGIYEVGERLPSIRLLSARERMSVSCVMQGLSLLEARGIIEARPKSGYFVRRRRWIELPEPSPTACKLVPHSVGVSDVVATVFRQAADDRKVPLGAGIPALELLPYDKLSRCLASATRETPSNLARYGDSAGYLELRKLLAKRFSQLGCPIPIDEVVITSGAMEALNLAIRSVTRPGDIVAVESPCYFGILQILESLGLKALSIPGTCSDGIDLNLLETAIENHSVKAVVLVPTFNNPSGSCMSENSRRNLISLLDDHGIALVEDDIYGDMHFSGERIRPVKSYDQSGNVLYCGSFSKSLSPGIRIGWVAGGNYTERVKRLKFISTLTTPLINQIAVTHFLAGGGMERHLRVLRQALNTQVSQVSQAVLECFPQGTAISQPKGGFFLWVQMPEGVDALELHQRADKAGINIVPGQIFCPHTDIRNRIRLSCGHPVDARIRKAIHTLGKLIRTIQKEQLVATS